MASSLSMRMWGPSVDRRVEWRADGRRPHARKLLLAWLVVVLLIFVWTLSLDDVSGMTTVVAVINVSVAVLLLAGTRTKTAADTHGIEVVGELRTRWIPWADVEEVAALRSEWTNPKVEVRLADGSSRALPGVPFDDVPRLEELRTLAQE